MTNFIKFFITTIFFVIFFISNSFSEIITKVKVLWNDRISLESIVVFGDIKLGENYEISDVNLLIKKLYTKDDMKKVKISKKQTENTVSQKSFIDSFLSSIKQKMYGQRQRKNK